MGIRGIYRELGSGRRVSLAKLAAESFRDHNRPLRLAIDVAIWQYQTQSARGGTNPAIRTLFYRLVRLLGIPVKPLFVFDGPYKPGFKRNKRSGKADDVATAQAKRLILLFGFAVHDAPGEAEAECALLQKNGLVDAVLSEDVDTIMFGCTRTLRNWSAETASSKTPTHVSLYDLNELPTAELGLDREGMVLVALMSGGDYLPDGIPGCGVKVACEAAKAGFGRSICRLKASDDGGIREWREALIHELKTNERGDFRTKHKALAIPDDFPNLEILRYYTHPVVSQHATLDVVRKKLDQKQEINVTNLREFARETFDWDYREGAVKFIRVIGPALLIHSIIQTPEGNHDYVKRISGRRTHVSTDATPELRLAFVPQEVVPIDLSKESDQTISFGRAGLALNSDDDFEAGEAPDDLRTSTQKMYDPAKTELFWGLEEMLRQLAPGLLHEWEAAEAKRLAPKLPKKRTAAGHCSTKMARMPYGALDGFVRMTKPSKGVTAVKKGSGRRGMSPPSACRLDQPVDRQHGPLSLPRLSKQPSRAGPNSPVGAVLSEMQGSSPVTPRVARPVFLPEAILISSSPPGHASPPVKIIRPKSPSLDIAGSAHFEVPCRLQATLCSDIGARSGLNSAHVRRGQPASLSSLQKSAPDVPLKQTSMDSFTSRSGTHPSSPNHYKDASRVPLPQIMLSAERLASEGEEDLSDASELEPLSSILGRPFASTHRSWRDDADGTSTEPGVALSRRKKKNLRVPRPYAAGYFAVEVHADERETRLREGSEDLGGRNERIRAARWSDVSVVDLTGDD